MCKGFRKVEKTCWVVLLNVQTWGGGQDGEKNTVGMVFHLGFQDVWSKYFATAMELYF